LIFKFKGVLVGWAGMEKVHKTNFLRLLKNTEKLIIAQKNKQANYDERLYREIFYNINLLEKNLAKLEVHDPTNLSNTAYRSKIDSLKELYVVINKERNNEILQAKENRENLNIQNASHHTSTTQRKIGEKKQKEQQKMSRKLLEDELFEKSGPEPTLFTEDILQNHRLLQEKLTNDILIMANHLKDTSEESYQILRKDNTVLDKVDEEMDKNIDKVCCFFLAAVLCGVNI
jgi:hypothetical protein